MDIGVRELKEHLSEYIERAARGEVIRVTNRGHPKALLAPLPDVPRERAIAEGWLRPGRKRTPVAVPRQVSPVRVGDVLDEDRGT